MRGEGDAVFILQLNVQQEEVKSGRMPFQLRKQRRRGGKTVDGIINIPSKVSGIQNLAEQDFIPLSRMGFVIADGNLVHRHSLPSRFAISGPSGELVNGKGNRWLKVNIFSPVALIHKIL